MKKKVSTEVYPLSISNRSFAICKSSILWLIQVSACLHSEQHFAIAVVITLFYFLVFVISQISCRNSDPSNSALISSLGKYQLSSQILNCQEGLNKVKLLQGAVCIMYALFHRMFEYAMYTRMLTFQRQSKGKRKKLQVLFNCT